jgi:hypothetical protein
MRNYDSLKQLATRQWPLRRALKTPDKAEAIKEFGKFIDEGPPVEPFRRKLKEVLAERYVWADALAVHFSHCYRSAYVLAYLLAALAVLIALTGIFVPPELLLLKVGLVLLELYVIFRILRLIRRGRRQAWHERWLEYRIVAESLRHARFLAYVSEFGHSRHDPLAPQPWTIWYIRATLREIGLPPARLDDGYQQPVLRATLNHEIAGQIRYHDGNARAMHKMDHFLHELGLFCFRSTLWVLVAFLALCAFYFASKFDFLHALYKQHLAFMYFAGQLVPIMNISKYLVVLFAAGLPAVGASLAGIRVQGDFEGSKERSERMVAELKALEADYPAAIERPRLERTADMLIETARVMSEDLAAWQELYGRKRLTLPA